MTNTVLILGANSLQLPLIEKANELGYKTLVVSPVTDEPGHEIATYSEACDVVDEEGVLKLAKKYDICGIITDQTDLPVRTMAYVANQLGLPGNDYEVAKIFTDKYLMREKCKEIGVKTVEYKMCKTLEEANAFYDGLNRDVILKPVDNQGSKGVYKVSSRVELEKRFLEAIKYSRSGSVLVEEYIVGREFVVEGIAVNYEYENLCCGDTDYFDIPDVFSATKREFPSIADPKIINKVLDINKKIAKGFGFKQGITHGEYILDGQDVILLEIAGRGGGVFISSDLIHLQTGLETEEFLLGVATGKIDKIPDFSWQNKSCCYISFFLRQGEVVEIRGMKEVIDLPYTYHNNFETLKVGQTIKTNSDKTSRFFVILEADNHDKLMERREYIKELLTVKIKNDVGIIDGIIWE